MCRGDGNGFIGRVLDYESDVDTWFVQESVVLDVNDRKGN